MHLDALCPLSRRAAAIFDAVVARFRAGTGSVRLDESPGTHMALHASRVLESEQGVTYSFAHFLIQCGAPVGHPAVHLLRSPDGEWYPLSFANRFGHRQYVTFNDDETIDVDLGRQRDLASFCDEWARNIAEGQRL